MANEFDWNYEETKNDFESEQIPNGLLKCSRSKM